MNDITSPGLGERTMKVVGTRPLRPDGVDKVTGRAKFGADIHLPNMLIGKVLRSPHAHARIKSIDTTKAQALAGVKAVITSADLNDLPSEFVPAGEMLVNYRDITRNVMAREKVLYEGHAVAAVAATSEAIAAEALKLIEVEYEVLPHVMDVVEAMEADAPLLHEDMYTIGVEPKPAQPSNVAKRVEFGHGDLAAGFAKADVVIEREFTTRPVHQGYIEPHACLASASRGRPGGAVVLDAGALHRARPLRQAARHRGLEAARDRLRDRRRLRRQDRGLPRAARARAVAQVRPAGEDGHVPHRGVPGDRSRPPARRSGSRSAPPGTVGSRRPMRCSSIRRARSRDRRCSRAACARSLHTTSTTCGWSATTWW